MSKIDLHRYQTVKAFLDDINLICSNALEYNPDKTPAGILYELDQGIKSYVKMKLMFHLADLHVIR